MPVPPTHPPTAELQTLDEIRDWHSSIVEALTDQRASVIRAIREDSAVTPSFVGMTEDGVETYCGSQQRELDRLTVLCLVASAEATIRVDYFRRVRGKLKDPLSKAYRRWHRLLFGRMKLRPDFDKGGILDKLRGANVMNNHIVGQFRECLRVRHWVGHGRYWARPPDVDRLDPDEVYRRAEAILQALP